MEQDIKQSDVISMTLVFVLGKGRVLLGEKKRGFGQGYWNGFGGKLEPGETPEQAAKRELKEEAGLTALELEPRGVLSFSFTDEQTSALTIHLFVARQWSGELIETEEMRPRWFVLDAIPYQTMWPADAHYLPQLLDGKSVRGEFIYEGKKLLRHNVNVVDAPL